MWSWGCECAPGHKAKRKLPGGGGWVLDEYDFEQAEMEVGKKLSQADGIEDSTLGGLGEKLVLQA